MRDLDTRRRGYADVRFGTEESAAAEVAEEIEDATDAQTEALLPDAMYGIDTLDLEADSTRMATDQGRISAIAARSDPSLEAILEGTPIVSARRGGVPECDYVAEWLLFVHTSSFPNADGERPPNMTHDKYTQVMLQRFPREQFAQNGLMVLWICSTRRNDTR